MLHDFRQADTPSDLDVPLCVVGGGAAGVTVTRRLVELGHSVLLIESGGIDHEAAIQDLSGGTASGQPYYDLGRVNLRMLGGTTAVWGGRCAELDPIDFRRRPWVPHSGWPIAREELAEPLRWAAESFAVPPPNALRDRLVASDRLLARLDGGDLAVGCWSFDERADRFALPRLGDLTKSPRVTVLLHATATRLHLSADGQRIESLDIADVGGRRGRVRASQFVLALGGIETPRLLLESEVGNSHDLVGRFFMEHPHARGGRLDGPAVKALLGAFGAKRLDGQRVSALLRLDEAAQERLGTLNTGLTIGARPSAEAAPWVMRTYSGLKHRLSPSRANRVLWRAIKGGALWVHERLDPLRPWLMIRAGLREAAIIIRAEQAPNPDSRITLGHERDALGMRRPHLDWRLSEIDRHSVRQLVGRLDAVLRSAGLGQAIPAAWLEEPETLWRTDDAISAHPIGGFHHMGTVRMGATASTGVVDGDGRVHGVENLYVAGSAVFPTSGWANPTLTLVALAIRLADHLDVRLTASKVASAGAFRRFRTNATREG